MATITNQRALRRDFWATYPRLNRRRVRDFGGKGHMYLADTRMAWCDYIDMLARDGTITQALAQRATLEG